MVCLRIRHELADDMPIMNALRVSGDTDGGPLVPEQIDHALVELAKRMLE